MIEITDDIKDIILELFNTGIGRSAVSLSELLGEEIILSVPTIEILIKEKDSLKPFFESKLAGLNEFVAVTQNFSGGLEGEGFLLFPILSGKTLVNTIMNQDENGDKSFDVLELEAISEVGNLVLNSVGCAISDMIEVEICSELPNVRIIKDLIELFNEQKEEDWLYIMGEALFSVKEKNIAGKIAFSFCYQYIEKIIQKFL
ncbi:MAG: hypothetical protein HQK76_10875 [Desulfobacterales bacterium]|nr:hypothetical protein [Desulfobacterales bacterium]